MNYLTDIHSHILPGIDDGSSSWEESIEMLQMAEGEGITTMIATPHFGMYNPEFDIEQAKVLVEELNTKAQEMGIGVKVLLGNELYYVQGVCYNINDRRASTMASSSYVLVEFSETVDLDTVKDAVMEFAQQGYSTIIAHIERYNNIFDRRLAGVSELKELGAYFQVNSRSLSEDGKRGLFSKKSNASTNAEALLNAGMVDFVGTDTHNSSTRVPAMQKAVERMISMVGIEETERILHDNTLALINDEYIR